MNTKQVVLNKLKNSRKDSLSKKVDLSILDQFSYGTYQDMQQEVDNLNYFTQEWFPEKFDQWYDLGRDIYSIYFQRGEPLLTEADFNTDEAVLDKIKEAADELGIEVTQVYPEYFEHKDAITEGLGYAEEFERQKQEFRDESKSV
tara:strand:+ start:385 stop:819 length:435 start_codon:yes stop_codon:yes gene_type:complete